MTYVGTTARVRDAKGMADLAVLLARPGRDVHCLELMGGGVVQSDAGPALDAKARRAYETRIVDLQRDIDDARDANDLVRAERAEAELDALTAQLAEAFGLGNRDRASGSSAERASDRGDVPNTRVAQAHQRGASRTGAAPHERRSHRNLVLVPAGNRRRVEDRALASRR